MRPIESITRSLLASAKEEPRVAANENDSVEAVLDGEEVAELLRVGRNTIYELVARNEIPHRRLLKQIRFSRSAVMAWLGPCGRSQGAQ